MKAWDMVPQTWIIECLAMFKREQIINSTIKDMDKMESGTNRRWINPSIGKDPKRHLSERLGLTTVICYVNEG